MVRVSGPNAGPTNQFSNAPHQAASIFLCTGLILPFFHDSMERLLRGNQTSSLIVYDMDSLNKGCSGRSHYMSAPEKQLIKKTMEANCQACHNWGVMTTTMQSSFHTFCQNKSET